MPPPPTSTVASVLRGVLDSIASIQGEQEVLAEDVTAGHNEDVLMKDAPSQGEHIAEKEAEL